MKKQGYRPTTISSVRTLKAVAKKANLLDPENVKTYLATANVSVGRKENADLNLLEWYSTSHRVLLFDSLTTRPFTLLIFLNSELTSRSP